MWEQEFVFVKMPVVKFSLLKMPVVQDLISSTCGGIGGLWAPIVFEYYDEGFDHCKYQNVIILSLFYNHASKMKIV